ncbi:MAG: penicillin-binding protein 2 [Verrucomicrobia bacterium]|nr:penicillin-binding protein 2 [Verrucomicrobiota bacterium]
MAKHVQYRRLMMLVLLLGAAFVGLGYRLVDLQVLRYVEFTKKSLDNTSRHYLLEPRRGDVLDAKGNLLATSVFTKTVCANPALIGNRPAEVARAIAPLLQVNESDLIQRLTPRLTRETNGVITTNHYVVLKRKVQIETWQKIQMAMTNISFALNEKKLPPPEQKFYRDLRRGAIIAENSQLRVYPNQALAAHVLGYVGMEEQEIDGCRMLETTGKDGIERSFLLDAVGVERFRRDPNGRGTNLTPDALRNRVIADVAEPGSTFKIVVVSGALNDGVVNLGETFDCEHGLFHFAGHRLHDHGSHGVLSVENIITKSSNIGAAKIGIKLGENRLYDYIRNYGFGTPTGLPLPGEVSGIVHPLKKWTKVSIAQIPMGHGIAVTDLQMVMAMSAIANKGVLMQPMIVDRLEDRDRKVVTKYLPQRVRQVIGEPAAALMVKALKTVVLPGGTAEKAALDHYIVAGKTGTANKPGPNGYQRDKYFTSFIGFFPADNPEVCISVMMDEPKKTQGYFGGQIAAPVFKQIAESVANYLNIRPDDGVMSPAPANPAMPLDDRPLKTASVHSQ